MDFNEIFRKLSTVVATIAATTTTTSVHTLQEV